MSEDLLNEQEAINSIYGEHTFGRSGDQGSTDYFLVVPCHNIKLRLCVPFCYPEEKPQILGIETAGDRLRKSHATTILACAREALSRVFSHGVVCMFDLLQELDVDNGTTSLPNHTHGLSHLDAESAADVDNGTQLNENSQGFVESSTDPPPQWFVSSTVTMKKSVFVARACPVTAPLQAKAALDHLVAKDKRVAKATHNITAYRICKASRSTTGAASTKLIYQDCDDDGETSAGSRLLHLLLAMDVWDVLVVVTRWYGGVQLGPDRFKMISQVAREAVVEGGWLRGGGRKSAKA